MPNQEVAEAAVTLLLALIDSRMCNPQADPTEFDALLKGCVAMEEVLYHIDPPAPAGWDDLSNVR